MEKTEMFERVNTALVAQNDIDAAITAISASTEDLMTTLKCIRSIWDAAIGNHDHVERLFGIIKNIPDSDDTTATRALHNLRHYIWLSLQSFTTYTPSRNYYTPSIKDNVQGFCEDPFWTRHI